MKRDWEIIRNILLKLESTETPNASVNMNSFSPLEAQEVAYNMRLLNEAGYIEAKILNSSTGDGCINAAIATKLTHKGHDLLDTMRNESVWNKIKETFKSKGIDMTFDLVINVGKNIIESLLS